MMRYWLALAAIALVVVIWMGRYEITGGDFVYRLDRWTGTVQGCTSRGAC